MYGYVRPVRDELKVRDYERFRGVYCGLCHTLRARYGPLLRFAVSYDLAFLAMLLAAPGTQEPEMCQRRCPYHPLRKTVCPQAFPGMETAADFSVLLARGKIRDEIRDGRFFPSLPWRAASLLLRPSCRRAAARRPELAEAAEQGLERLVCLEQERTAGLDAAADAFAGILREAGGDPEGGSRSRILRELLYHLGRIIYILDAVDDLRDDQRRGAYNPLLYRFSVKEGVLSEEDAADLRTILTHSHNSICAAYALLDPGPYRDILDNVIYYGLPAATEAVFSGSWKVYQKRFRGRNRL